MRQVRISEKELKQLFNYPTPFQKIWWTLIKIFKSGLIFCLLFIFFFALINFPAYWKKISFTLQGEKFSQNLSPADQKALEPIKLAELKLNQSAKNNPPKTNLNLEQQKNYLPPNRLIIPKLKINAPIIWNIPSQEIIAKLQEGVVHYQGTNLPGENGNVFITGHSSNFWWAKGDYNQVFALLDELKPGNKIYLTYQKKLYIYQVEEKKVVNPTHIEVMKPKDHSILSLMTCYPVGTTINRLIVTAKQILPHPQKTSPQPTKNEFQYLPIIR